MIGALVGGLDRVRGVAHRPWARGKFTALVIAIAATLLAVATTLAILGGSRLVDAVAEQVFGKGAPNVATRFLYLIGTTGLLVFTIAVYHFGPNAPRRRLLASVPGTVVGVAIWFGITRLFALYIENFDSYRTVYGALAGAAIYLIFLFLTCVALLVGAEVNEQWYVMRVRRKARGHGGQGGRGGPHSGLTDGAPVGGAVGVALPARAHRCATAAARLAAAFVDPGALAAPRRRARRAVGADAAGLAHTVGQQRARPSRPARSPRRGRDSPPAATGRCR